MNFELSDLFGRINTLTIVIIVISKISFNAFLIAFFYSWVECSLLKKIKLPNVFLFKNPHECNKDIAIVRYYPATIIE